VGTSSIVQEYYTKVISRRGDAQTYGMESRERLLVTMELSPEEEGGSVLGEKAHLKYTSGVKRK